MLSKQIKDFWCETVADKVETCYRIARLSGPERPRFFPIVHSVAAFLAVSGCLHGAYTQLHPILDVGLATVYSYTLEDVQQGSHGSDQVPE